MNAILSIGSLSGIIMSNSLLLMIVCYGKVGYYPFFLVLSMLWFNSSYLFILLDLINKWAYYSSFIIILNLSIFFRCSEYWLVLINLLIIISSIRHIISIKQLVFLSSMILFIYLYLLLLLNNYLFSCLFLLSYVIINNIILIKYSFLYVHWIIPWLGYLRLVIRSFAIALSLKLYSILFTRSFVHSLSLILSFTPSSVNYLFARSLSLSRSLHSLITCLFARYRSLSFSFIRSLSLANSLFARSLSLSRLFLLYSLVRYRSLVHYLSG